MAGEAWSLKTFLSAQSGSRTVHRDTIKGPSRLELKVSLAFLLKSV